jgi:hypothetical protein
MAINLLQDKGTPLHHAIHVAELADNDGWRLLIKLARELGQDDMAGRFQTALKEEDRHRPAGMDGADLPE